MEKYLLYDVEDFVLDEEFVRWAASRSKPVKHANSSSSLIHTVVSDEKWDKFLSEHPEKEDIIEKALFVIRSLEPLEADIPGDRLDALWQRISKSGKSEWPLLKYAAIFLIAFLLGWGSYQFISGGKFDYTNTYTEIKIPYGERSEVALYDGTRVWLNSGSRLKFPLVFKQDQRMVFIEGEAFFDVAGNKEKPFIVTAGNLNIEVLGTRFNICAYPDDRTFYATLEEGSILATNTLTGEKLRLKPGNQAILDLETTKMKLQSVDTGLYTSWKENMMRFENAKFSEVIKKMERWYDVKILVDEGINIEERYTMTIKTESLREMLRLLSFTTPIKYEIMENKVFIKAP